MRKFLLLVVVVSILVLLPISMVSAASPHDGPPGLERAIAAQEAHNPKLLRIQGVVGTAIGLDAAGKNVIRIFTEREGVAGLPQSLDGVPVAVQVTGKIIALKGPPAGKGPNKGVPEVSIISPVDSATYEIEGDNIELTFAATVTDDKDVDLEKSLEWKINNNYIHYGNDFNYSLGIGVHKITASVTDSDENTGSDSISVTVVKVGSEPTSTTEKWPRPVAIGISTGNARNVSAGTIACRVRDAQGNLYALSNTHVYAPRNIDNLRALGNKVSQPGVYDIPRQKYSSEYYLGQLADYVPIDGSILGIFLDINFIDAAIASTDSAYLGQATPSWGYGMPQTTPVEASLGMSVKKFGRTTGLTKGVITGINAKIIVGYDTNWYAAFSDQIIVESNEAFILRGDSGSLLVSENNNPVGLLFAGDDTGQMAFANNINRVLEALNVTIDGD
jgi:hypothetical protein